MTAKEFWTEFSAIFKEQENNQLKNFWCSNKEYTKLIICHIAEFLKKNDLKTQREYYNIDLIGWKQLKDEKLKQA